MDQLAKKLFGKKYKKHTRLFDEGDFSNFYVGLGNPNLTDREREDLIDDVDADTPELENSIETDHFILRWTNPI